LRLGERRHFDGGETDFAPVSQKECATVDDALRRTLADSFAIAAEA
jgi:hypothetical protein